MSPFSREQRRAEAAKQAATWLVTLQADQVSGEARGEFIDWLRESPLHVAEMLHVCQLHRDLSLFKRWADVPELQSDAVTPLVAHLPQPGTVYSPGPTSRRWRIGVGLAAGLIGAVVALSMFINRAGESAWQTEAGERREVTLSDGSIVDLAPSSKVRVRIGTQLRSIKLDRGEALFHVAKDANRPFIVEASSARVRAVGTVFNVEHRDTGVAVTVVEGRVMVSEQDAVHPEATAATGVPLAADEQLLVPTGGHVQPAHRVKAELEVAWASGQLMFNDQPVAEIARRFNLYNHVQLQIADKELAERRVGGVFRATDPESFVAFVESAGGVEVLRPDRNQIVLRTPVRDAVEQPH
jgi:transmembrane sensor